MLMIGVKCEGCGCTLIDSGDTCFHCGRPKSAFAMKIQQHYQALKDVRPDVLADIELKIARAEKRFGGTAPKEYIERLHNGLYRK